MWQISRPPCEWCEFGQVFNGQLEHPGDWKTAESWPMLKFFGQNHLKFYLNGGHFYEIFLFIAKLGPQTLGRFWQMGGCRIA